MTGWRQVPKVELHLHLEGAAPPDFIRGLAAEKGMDIAGAFDGAGGYRWGDFAEFLATYELACSVLREPDDFRRLVEAVLARSAEQGVIYTEIFLAPDLCGDGSAAAWAEYLAAMEAGAEAAEIEHGILCRFIPTAIRHFGAARAEHAARLSAASAGGRVVGFGMGGEERFGVPCGFCSCLCDRRGGGARAHGPCRGGLRAGKCARRTRCAAGVADRAWGAGDRGSGACRADRR